MNPVLDASVFVAAISPSERHHAQARALFDSHPDTLPYLVPALFRVEVIAALSRRGESSELLDTVDALVRGPRFFTCQVDAHTLDQATKVARQARLRAYDAVYVALAMITESPLYTMDNEVCTRIETGLPEVVVRSSV